MSWRWANASIAEVAARDLRLSLAPILAASAQGGTRLRTTLGSSVAIAVDHQATTIALAPSPSMAQALAAANAG
jgi:hypothetical protein